MAAANISEFGLVPWEYENPQYFESFWFEKVDGNNLRVWAKRNLPVFGIICAVYFLFIWLGPKWMKTRKAYNLEKPLAVWNFSLALFSLAVVTRMLPSLVRMWMKPNGYYKSVCTLDGLHYQYTFWGFLFAISKVFELGDTVFLVLRKKPIVFLHGFHHFNMVWSTLSLYVEGEPSFRYVEIINSCVHFVMYTYFGLRALHVKLPQNLAMAITSLQIIQFLYGVVGQYQVIFLYPGIGRPCFRTTYSLIVTTIFVLSYLFLFMRLFYKSYIVNDKRKVKTT